MMSRPRRDDLLERLTPRQHEVLALMAEGRSNGAIAEQLTLTTKAVARHVSHVYDTLGLAPGRGGPPPRPRRGPLPLRMKSGSGRWARSRVRIGRPFDQLSKGGPQSSGLVPPASSASCLRILH